MQAGQARSGINFFEPLTFPFREPGAWITLSWVMLMAFVPALDFVLFRGWSLDIVRRVANRRERVLPEFDDIGQFSSMELSCGL